MKPDAKGDGPHSYALAEIVDSNFRPHGAACAVSSRSALARRYEEPKVCTTLRWREMDSNFQYAGAVNLVVGPFGWVVLAIGCGPGEALWYSI